MLTERLHIYALAIPSLQRPSYNWLTWGPLLDLCTVLTKTMVLRDSDPSKQHVPARTPPPPAWGPESGGTTTRERHRDHTQVKLCRSSSPLLQEVRIDLTVGAWSDLPNLGVPNGDPDKSWQI